MKLAIRIFAMLVVFAGLTAASMSSSPASGGSYFGATISGPGPLMPGPPCPTCNGGGGLQTR